MSGPSARHMIPRSTRAMRRSESRLGITVTLLKSGWTRNSIAGLSTAGHDANLRLWGGARQQLHQQSIIVPQLVAASQKVGERGLHIHGGLAERHPVTGDRETHLHDTAANPVEQPVPLRREKGLVCVAITRHRDRPTVQRETFDVQPNPLGAKPLVRHPLAVRRQCRNHDVAGSRERLEWAVARAGVELRSLSYREIPIR